MHFKTVKNIALGIIQENTEMIGITSAILLLYYNPTLYFTILGVGITIGLYNNFKYNLNIDFKMQKNENTQYISLNSDDQEEVFDSLNKSFMSDKIQTDTEIDAETETESILCKSKSMLFE